MRGLGELPADDRQRSPHTGFTRRHWEVIADRLLAAAWRHASPGGAQLHFPGGRASQAGPASDGLEGFARTFLLAAFRLRGSAGACPGELAARYAAGLAAGTDPSGPEAWPPIVDRAQAMVEAASVALALFETRPWIWDRLDDGVRQRTAEWLAGFHGRQPWPNNWLLFQVIANAFLKSVGAPYRQDEMDANLARIDSYYRADGWYSDGPGENYDWYCGWAMHLYTAWWCRMDGDDPARVARVRARLRRYLADARLLFGGDGAPLYHGRSLIYRFAAVAPFFAGALLGATPLAPGETRRLASGALRHFLARGALRDDGTLSMGWHDEFLPMAQAYSGPGSPYWAAKAFVGLLLPADDPVWTACEQPLAVERGDFVAALPAPGLLAIGTQADGIVRVANHRGDHYPYAPEEADDLVYRKLAYSTHTAPDHAATTAPDAAPDNHVALVAPDGRPTRRLRFRCLGVADRFAGSVSYPGETFVLGERSFPLHHDRVETVTIALGGGVELRLHHVMTMHAGFRLRAAGYAVAGDAEPERLQGSGWVAARTAGGLISLLLPLAGWAHAALAPAAFADEAPRGPLGRRTLTPFAESAALGAEHVCAELVSLSGVADGLDRCLERRPSLVVDARRVRIETAAGDWYFVQLVEPEEVTLPEVGASGRIRWARRGADGSGFVRTE